MKSIFLIVLLVSLSLLGIFFSGLVLNDKKERQRTVTPTTTTTTTTTTTPTPTPTPPTTTTSFWDHVNWDACSAEGRSASLPYVSGDGFRCLADFIFDETTHDQLRPPLSTPQKRCVIIFVKTELLPAWLTQWHDRIRPMVSSHGYILVAHNSDLSPDVGLLERVFSEQSPHATLKRFYGQNLPPLWRHPMATPLPIGLENARWGRQKPQIYAECLQKKKSSPSSAQRTALLVSFNPNTDERKRALEAVSKLTFAHVSLKTAQTAPFEQHLQQSKWVLSPPGNGLDCHRTWEALSCGCIPVLRKGTLHPDTLGNAPCAWVDSWTDIVSEKALVDATHPQPGSSYTVHLLSHYMRHFENEIRKM